MPFTTEFAVIAVSRIPCRTYGVSRMSLGKIGHFLPVTAKIGPQHSTPAICGLKPGKTRDWLPADGAIEFCQACLDMAAANPKKYVWCDDWTKSFTPGPPPVPRLVSRSDAA